MNHTDILNDLEARLEYLCDCICREHEFICGTNTHGEYDLAAIRIDKNTVYVFEVKKTNLPERKRKALEQLGKDYIHFKEQFPPYEHIKLFYAYSDKSMKRGYNIDEIK